MSVYFKIAFYGTAIMLLSLFIIQINEDMQSTTIQDINTAYKNNPIYGGALGAPGGNNTGDHTLYIAGYEIPYIGETLHFMNVLLSMIWMVLSTLLSYLADIALLSTKFPSFLTPIIAIGQLIILVAWYKVLWPGE